MSEITWQYPIKSPTGLGMRNDDAGLGHHEAPRGGRRHDGMDFKCIPGQVVYSPIEGYCMRYAYAYPDRTYSGVRIQGRRLSVLLLYVMPDFGPDEVITRTIHQGDMVGIAQDITERYGEIGMTPHVHLRIEKCEPRLLMNPKWIPEVWEEE